MVHLEILNKLVASLKLFISVDMEGIGGVINYEHTCEKGMEHEHARRLMTGEVNAAIETALEMGATEVVVSDSHYAIPNQNIIIEELNPAAYLINGTPRPLSQLQGVDESFDAAFLMGYHAREGTRYAIMPHSYHGKVVRELNVNGVVVGETGINTYVLGDYGVPVILVSGDAEAVKEAEQLVPNVETAVVKWPIGAYSAKSLHPTKAREIIREAVKMAITKKDQIKPVKLKGPVTVEVKLKSTGMADVAELIPTVERIDGVTVRFVSDNMVRAYRTFQAVVLISSEDLQKDEVFQRQ